MIKLDNVNKYYNKGGNNQIHVINETTLTLPDTGIFCLLGPSGCGKTTLLNAIGGLDKVDSGTITVDGQRITRFSSGRIDNIRNANIGYIFQNFNLLDDRTVFENVSIALQMIGIRNKATVQARVKYCLERVGIYQYRNRLAGSLSGGQRQRVAIARAIVKNPKIIIADEPTGNLDSANTLEIMNIIKAISRERLVILVTHERNIAEFYSDHIAEMKDGKIVNIYDNDRSRHMNYQLENKIYLKDMTVHKELHQDDVSFDVYSDEEQQARIKIVLRGGNLYIDTGGNYKVVDERSNVELVDDHYSAMDESYFDDHDFDYTAYLPPRHEAKYSSVYRLSNILSSGWTTVKNFKRAKKVLLLGFVVAAMFAFLAVSNVLGLLEVKPVDYRTTNGNYVTIANPNKTESLLKEVEDLKSVTYVLPGETKKIVSLPLDDFWQSNSTQEDIAVSIALNSVLDPEQLVAGSMPAKVHDVVLDRMVIDSFLRDNLGKTVGLDSAEEFVGRRIAVPNLDDYRIVGISDTESPSLFVDQSQVMYILSNASDVNNDISFNFVEGEESEIDEVVNGNVKDIDLAKSKVEIIRGRKPEKAYETVINESNEGFVELGEKTDIKVGNKKLTVVGFYESDIADDDTYYVDAKTIRKHYISKQNYLTAYAPDTALLKSILDTAGVPGSVNDIRDRSIYINARKDQLISAILVAGIIMLISLIEMFLMLRSSFLSRIKEVGTLRAIGLKKKDIYRMFTGEILVITLITAIPGIAIMYFVITQLVNATYYLEGSYMVTPAVAAISFAIILVFNLLAGLLPVFATLRKTPAQILARTDI